MHIFNYYGLVLVFYPSVILLLVSIKQINSVAIQRIGTFQFEVYIWNVPIYSLFVLAFNCINKDLSFHHSYLTMIGFALLIEIIAILMYYYAEKPLTNIIREKIEV